MEGQSKSDIRSQVEQIRERIKQDELRMDRLQNTLKAITRETSEITISGPCNNCERCFMLLKNGMIYCPQCGDGRSL